LNIIFQHEDILLNFIIGIFLASFISFFSYRFKLLTRKGSYAVFILAILVYGFGGWKFTIPIFTFFILSSFLSMLRKKKNPSVETYFEKTGERDHFQVLANGGIAGLLAVLNYFYPSELLYIVYVSTVAAVCADTWATETGTVSENKTINILTLKKVEQGVSGGVSVNGLIGSFAGAFVIALTSLFWIQSDYIPVLLIISFAGFLASLADSFLGASVQALYKCSVCEKVTEKSLHCNKPARLHKGVYWVNNDMVNTGTGLSGGIFSFLLADIIRI
jgi:uncharacterized protein (TIGR00297 family)